jgi:hypothetical protein
MTKLSQPTLTAGANGIGQLVTLRPAQLVMRIWSSDGDKPSFVSRSFHQLVVTTSSSD